MRFALLTGLLWGALPGAQSGGVEFFEKNIRPILATRCYGCHSAQANPVQGGLYADTRAGLLRGGKSGAAAVVPGKPEESLLIKALQHTHKDLKMPPGQPLAAQALADFVEWVQMGAPDPREGAVPAPLSAYDWEKERKHWAYQPLHDSPPPLSDDAAWRRTPVDRFVKAALDAQGLRPLGRASKIQLLRRVTYDLTGLPPTPAEVKAFSADLAPAAFEKVVERLLASPAYGERWGRHWLDVVRYADTAGDAADYPVPEMARYRNYVIRSLNEDKPYDRFVREQIAGDLMPAENEEDRRDKIVATGYIANARRFGQAIGEHYLTIDDTIDNLSKALLGLTAGCARCHDHKFDPIPTRDYYALFGIFKSTNYPHAGMEHNQYLENFSALNKGDEERLKSLQGRLVGNYKVVKAGKNTTPEEKLQWLEAKDALAQLRKSWPDIPMAYAVNEGAPQNQKVMLMGEPRTLGAEVQRGFFQILGGQTLPEGYPGSGRALLAGWIADAKNPLTARVIVNRVWLWHFGRGLVNSPNDFGARGERPTHPELLDWLTLRFIEDGWSLKKLHRRIVLTRAYQTASGHAAASASADAKNEFYWRFDRRRLSAEELRDSLLAVSGQLENGAPPPHAFGPRAGFELTQHNPYVADVAKTETNRRGVYMLQQRFRRHPYLELFEGADSNNSTPSRTNDSTALQSLYFMNDEFVHRAADQLAVRAGMSETLPAARVTYAYRLLYGRAPLPSELQLAAAHVAKAKNEVDGRQAWASLMRALIAMNEFLYVD